MAHGWVRSEFGPTAVPAYLVGAGALAAVTYGYVAVSGIRLAEGRIVVDGFVELLMLGIPAVGLLYAGYWLHDAGFDPDHVWRIGGFAVAGSLLGASITAVALVGIPTPTLDTAATFALFVSTATEGGLIGVLVGTFATTTAMLRHEEDAVGEYERLHALLRHNIRNRLTVLNGQVTRLAEGTGGYDADAMAAVEAQVQAIDDLLAATKLATDAVGARLEPSPVDLVDVVASQVRLLESGRDVEVTAELPDRAPVRAGHLLGPVIENLLDNAVEHNDAPTPEVTVRVTTGAGQVRLEVADNGPGIPPAQREAVFEAGTGDGTGMGLYLARTIVERYGGTIELGANDPRGTVVTVTLAAAD